MSDEILVKGTDGKWYILQGEALLPYDEKVSKVAEVAKVTKELPKGVSGERVQEVTKSYKRLQDVAGSLVDAPGKIAAISHEEHPLNKELEEGIDKVVVEATKVSNVAKVLEDPLLQKRFRMIVSARLREVRDNLETRAILMREQKVGGVGLSEGFIAKVTATAGRAEQADVGDQVSGVMEIIEHAFGGFQEKWKAREAQRREEWRRKQQEQRGALAQNVQHQEQEDLEKRYSRLTGQEVKVAQVTEVAKVADVSNVAKVAEVAKVTKVAEVSNVAKVTEVTNVAKVAKVTEAAEVVKSVNDDQGSIVPSVSPLPVVAKVVGVAEIPKITKMPAVSKTSVTAGLPVILRPSDATAALPFRSGKITDVRTAPRHLGPVEEIGFLTVEDFRRLPGAKAAERVSKIFAKIELLGQDSLSKKSQGLEAWRRSPLNILYGSIVHAALHGRIAPEQIITQWTKERKPCLTIEEFHAIMELNAKLRF